MTTQVNNEIPSLKYDGRIMSININSKGEIWGSFNTRKPTGIKLTKEQFNRYKSFCEPPKQMILYGGEVIDFYGVIHDSGMPKWFNWF